MPLLDLPSLHRRRPATQPATTEAGFSKMASTNIAIMSQRRHRAKNGLPAQANKRGLRTHSGSGRLSRHRTSTKRIYLPRNAKSNGVRYQRNHERLRQRAVVSTIRLRS